MTEAQALEAVYEAWAIAWSAAQPGVPFVFGNEVLDNPPATWARVTLRNTVRVQASMGPPGTRRFESRGRVAVQLFGDVNVGDGPLAAFADSVRASLEGKTFVIAGANFYTQAGTTNEGMNGGNGNAASDGRWAMKLVSIPFWYQTTG